MSGQKPSRKQAYALGHRAEALAALSLRLKGYRILARRYRSRSGEIDLIARRGNLIAIIEVKARPTLVLAMEAISSRAEQRINRTADEFLSRQKDYAQLSVRFDLIAVLPWRWPVHVENIFHART